MGAAIVSAVEAHFLDQDFLSTPQWQDLAARVDALPDPDDAESFRAIAHALLDELPFSHVQLQTPEEVADARSRGSGNVPAPLRMSARRGPGWVYLRLPSFTLPAFTAQQFLAGLGQASDSDTLVVDVRLNAGGSLSCAGVALGALLGGEHRYAQTALGTYGPAAVPRIVRPFPEEINQNHEADVAAVRSGATDWVTAGQRRAAFDNPVVLLVGARCYSAGEIFAQALKECRRATLVGTRTAGAVVAADDFDLPHGWRLTLPFAALRSGSGTPLEGIGVEPDVHLDFGEPDTSPLSDEAITSAAKLS